jgi:hypothetical protein
MTRTLDLPRNTCAWYPGLTETFRNSSRKLLDDYGSNLQNPSDSICRIYKADKGKILVQCDQKSAEAVIVAYLCERGSLRKLIEQNIKPHVFIAMHIFKQLWAREGHPIVHAACAADVEVLKFLPGWKELASAIKNNHERYFIGKKTCHSCNYDQGANTYRMAILSESEGKINLTREEAGVFILMYKRLFPEIPEWHRETRTIIDDTGVLRNLFGYPREFFGPRIPKLYKEAYAYVPQSTVGVLGNMAFVEEQDYIDREGVEWDLLNNKHDSTLTQCPEDESEWRKCAEIKCEIVEKEFTNFRGEKFRMGSEVSVGYNWGKFDPEKNPEGLKEVCI